MRSNAFAKWSVAGSFGVLMFGLAAQGQIFTGTISFVGGATIDQPVPNATTVTSFYGPGGPGTGPVVQGGSQSGVYLGVPGGTPASFVASFPFNPTATLPFQLWAFSVGQTTYSFDVTSVGSVNQFVLGSLDYLNIGGSGMGYVTGYSPTPEVWSLTGTTASDGSLTLTMGNSVNAVPEPSDLGLLTVSALFGGWLIAKRRLSWSSLRG